MPPKMSVAAPLSPSPPPMVNDDAQDILVIQDLMDTLDQIPPELTRVFSDLNELGAVLYSTLIGLEEKLYKLINWIQDPTIKPEKRFELLQEIAEEAARYKLGGDDKIRVAGGACDGIMAHQKHISNLLAASSLLNPSPPSPYTQTLTLPHAQPVVNSRRLQRAANSPSRQYAAKEAALNEARVGDTPTKKKKGRVGQLVNRDDDETSSVGGDKEKKKATKKRKPANRAASPTDSVASTSAFTGKTTEPRTARQLAAAASRARKAEQDDNSDDESAVEGSKNGTSAAKGGPTGQDWMDRLYNKPGEAAPADQPKVSSGAAASATANGGARNGSRAKTSGKRSRDDEDEDEDSDAPEDKPAPKRTGSAKKTTQAYDFETIEPDMGQAGEELDSKTYCTCGQVSYGEMIGCDDDNCEIEWYHLACLDLDKTPEGNWICPRCVERRKKQPKGKKASKTKAKK
ncbi:hypothetical protein IAU60_000492 [Kwoniella sp. DSM 27419]